MGIQIDDLPAVTSITGLDEFPLVQGGITRVGTVNQLITALQGGLLNELPEWQPFTTYLAGVLVVNPSGAIVQALARFTSGATFDATKWTPLSLTVAGVQALVGTETTRAQAAESTLTQNLAAEVTRAQAAEQALQAALLSELPEWQPNTAYATQTLVVNPAGLIVQAMSAVPPRASYTPADWTILSLTLATVQALIAAQAAADSSTYSTLAQALLAWTLTQAFQVVSASRDANEAITTASVVWPDGATGTFTTDTASTAFPGAIDAYHVTHVLAGTTKTVTQPAVTRDAGGAVTAQPALTVA